MANVNETLLGIQIKQDSLIWGGEFQDEETCLWLPWNGFFKRENESFVLPHAVGCQTPTLTSDYVHSLKGFVDNTRKFNS